MRRTVKHIDVQALVKEMIEAGASFRFTPAGTLLVDGLELLPRYLIDAFFEANERALVVYLHNTIDRKQQAAFREVV